MQMTTRVALTGLLGVAGALAAGEGPGAAPAAAVARWQDMRFGMFVHWGPVSLKGTEIGWSRGAQVPVEEYDGLHKRFNPQQFDAGAWARTAKAAGMKYLVITSKHHDGFCLWDSAATDFDIMASPFGRDVLKELSAACRAEGIAFGTYHSVCDWRHPAFPLGSPGGRTHKPHPDLRAYDAYLQQQVAELVTNYGPLVSMWFDVPQSYGADLGVPMVRRLRALQPDILVNNRAYAPAARPGGGPQLPVGDFDTPEQHVGAWQDTRPWETCMTICNQWSWKPNDAMKTLGECLRILATCAGGNGNLLLNVGPMPDGRIEPRQAARLEEMGAWLATRGESIHGTRGGPVKPGRGFVTTRRGNTVYLHVFDGAPDEITLPAFPRRILRAEVLGGGAVETGTRDDAWVVTLPPALRQPAITVVRLTLDASAMDLPAAAAPTGFRPATASNVYQNEVARFGPDMAFDGDPATRWATDAGTAACRLEAGLARPGPIRGIEVDEAPDYSGRVEEFTVQALSGGRWVTVAAGTALGRFSAAFDPVDAAAIRLDITRASEGPTISEVRVRRAD